MFLNLGLNIKAHISYPLFLSNPLKKERKGKVENIPMFGASCEP
jgi:hypothetical protein